MLMFSTNILDPNSKLFPVYLNRGASQIGNPTRHSEAFNPKTIDMHFICHAGTIQYKAL